MKKELTFMPTGACNMDCPNCSQRAWRADFCDYQMSMDEVRLICRRVKELGLHYERLYLTGGEPTLWDSFKDGCLYAKASGAFRDIWVSSNCIEAELLSKALRVGLIDGIYAQMSNASPEGVRLLQRRHGRKVSIGRHRPVHKPLPLAPLDNVLPAECGCDRPVAFNYRLYPCAGVYPHMRRLGLNMDEPRIWASLDENWSAFFRGKDRFNSVACQVCVANRKVWNRMPTP